MRSLTILYFLYCSISPSVAQLLPRGRACVLPPHQASLLGSSLLVPTVRVLSHVIQIYNQTLETSLKYSCWISPGLLSKQVWTEEVAMYTEHAKEPSTQIHLIYEELDTPLPLSCESRWGKRGEARTFWISFLLWASTGFLALCLAQELTLLRQRGHHRLAVSMLLSKHPLQTSCWHGYTTGSLIIS